MACTLASSVRGLSASTRTSRPAQRAQRLVVRAANRQSVQDAVMKGAALAGLSAALLNAGSAQAAMEVANIAAGDNRFGTIATLAVPVVGWVGFNILGPLQNQLNDMAPAEKVGRKRSVAAGLGLGAASLLSAQSAEAAQQVADVAASDNRFGLIALLALPVVGWVGFNILGPLQNQLNEMGSKPSGGSKQASKKKRSFAVGLGLGAASLMAAQNAEAAQQVADLAAGDNRVGILALLAVPALGWVGFNILGPLQNQLDSMAPVQKVGRKRSVAAGLGLGAASLLAAQSAEAAQQVADVAASDNRFGIIALLAVPVVGWVGFNILGPLQNQLNEMGGKPSGGRAPVKKRK